MYIFRYFNYSVMIKGIHKRSVYMSLMLISLISQDILQGQEKISLKAYTVDREAVKSLPYVEIGFLNREKGTISNKKGYFELDFDKKNYTKADTLQFRKLGYYPINIAFSEIEKIFSENSILPLLKIEGFNKTLLQSLAEKNVVIDKTPISFKKNIRFWKTSSLNGNEIITPLKSSNRETNTLKAIYFYTKLDRAKKLKIRLKFYEYPNEKFLDAYNYKTVYHVVEHSGLQKIEVENLNLDNNKDYHIGIQPVDSFGKDFTLSIALDENTHSFGRLASNSNLIEFPFNGIFFSNQLYSSIDQNETYGAIDDKKNLKDSFDSLIEGRISKEGKPIEGANVRINGKLTEVKTESDGSFELMANKNDVVEITSLTTKPRIVKVSEFTSESIDLENRYIQLDSVELLKKRNIESVLDEDVNTPFGLQSKKSIGYAAYSKDIEELNKTAINFRELIIARFPGTTFRGSLYEYDIYSRGASGHFGQSILVVVDGVPDQLNGAYLDVFNIANVTFIPGGAGVARYGGRAAGGVMLVTTKMASLSTNQKNKTSLNNMIFSDNYQGDSQSLSNYKKNERISNYDNTYTNKEDLISEYLSLRKENYYAVPFYLKFYDKLKNKDINFANSILENLENIADNNIKALRTLAYTYEENDNHESAKRIYKKIGLLDAYSVQGYLDLAQSYTNLEDYNKAAEIYNSLVNNQIPGLKTDETSRELAEIKLRHLLTKYKTYLNLQNIDIKYYQKSQVIDALAVIQWNDVSASFNMQYVDPEGKYHTSFHNAESDLNRLLLEKSIGYNSEYIVIASDKKNSRWMINVEGVESEFDKLNPNYLKLTVYRNYGTRYETEESSMINIDKLSNNLNLAELNF